MKKIIDGKTYNTETATHIGNRSHSYPGDFSYCDEDLYLTKKGTFFLAGAGGAMSKYSQSCGQNTQCGGSGMEVLSNPEALSWCERYDIDSDIIEQYFEIEEG